MMDFCHVFCFSGTTEQHPLMAQAMVLAQTRFPPVWTDTHYNNIDYTTLLDRLLMFVTYLAHELR